MTNEEKIKNMSRWELAEFIYAVSNCEIEITTCKAECDKCKYSDSFCVSNIGEWLMEESKGR